MVEHPRVSFASALFALGVTAALYQRRYVAYAQFFRLHQTLPALIRQGAAQWWRLAARNQACDKAGVRLITRHDTDFTARFPLAVQAVSALSARSFLLDGEAIVTNDRGLAVFDLIRHKRHGEDALLIAFDLIELDGEDLRRTPIEQRKHTLARLVRRSHAGIVLNEVFEGDGDILFKHACKLGCEGIVSKRLGSPYRSGRSPNWVKVKNPKAPAVKREGREGLEPVTRS
jgi:bifunctional non-homologous end joining protein LigD